MLVDLCGSRPPQFYLRQICNAELAESGSRGRLLEASCLIELNVGIADTPGGTLVWEAVVLSFRHIIMDTKGIAPPRPSPSFWTIFVCRQCSHYWSTTAEDLHLGSASLSQSCTACEHEAVVRPVVVCPHDACRKHVRLEDVVKVSHCPYCTGVLDDGIPLEPMPPTIGFIDRVLAGRAREKQTAYATALRRFQELHAHWVRTSNGEVGTDGSVLRASAEEVARRHDATLQQFESDVQKFLFTTRNLLSRDEGRYSWELEQQFQERLGVLLEGILGRQYPEYSLGLLVRCHDKVGGLSRSHLRIMLQDLWRAYNTAPPAGHEVNLEFVRSLNGRQFEKWLRDFLLANGISDVAVTPQSRDQGADLIVHVRDRRILIQAKQYAHPVGNSAVQEVHASITFYGATEGWVVTTSGFTSDAIELARRTGVQLVPGAQLFNLPHLLLGTSAATSTEEVAHTMPLGAERALMTQAPSKSPATPDVSPRQETPAGRQRTTLTHLVQVGFVLMAIVAVTWVIMGRFERGRTEREVRAVLAAWANAAQTSNLTDELAWYAPTVGPFFRMPRATHEQVAQAKAQLAAKYPHVTKYALSKITVDRIHDDHVTVSFDKEWEAIGAQRFAGSERERLELRRINGNWRIAAEQELQIYWVRTK